MSVGLAPGAADVVGKSLEPDGRGPKAIVHGQPAAQGGRERSCVLLHHEVEIERDAAEQEVTYRAADQVDPWAIVQRGQQRPRRRQRSDQVQELVTLGK